MAIEQGIVIKMGLYGPTTAWVKTVRSSACESCASRDSCNPDGGEFQEVEAINDANARVGDRIQISISSGAILKATFLLYLFPVICMIAGGVFGNWLAPSLGTNPSAIAALAALLCLGASLLIVRAGGQHMGSKDTYRPRIIRIIGRELQNSLEKSDPLGAGGYQTVENKR